MKIIRCIMVFALLSIFSIQVGAKPIQPKHVYMFGFSASFSDSTVYVTDIQDVKGAWIDNKTKFLISRDNYSYQLKDYFINNLQQNNRICMVFFATSKSNAEKQMKKLMKLYVPNPKKKKKNWKSYDVHYLTSADFKFSPIDMSPEQ